MSGYIKNVWLRISLKKKLGVFSIIVILVMGFSIAFNMLVINFSLNSFNVILNDNSQCHDVQEAIGQEVAAFEAYIRERTPESKEKYRLTCLKTQEKIGVLPFDYTLISPERYARTWNIKNGYEGYSRFRHEVSEMDPQEQEFVEKLYRVYGMQEYLQTYARRLMQVTIKEGKSRYQEKVPVFYNIPYLIILYSVAMMITVICLTKLLYNTLINPMVNLARCSRKIAKNDFGGEDVTVENQDEMGELVQAFNKMKHATEGYINTLKEKNEMAERLHKEEVDRIETEKRLDAARLELLKSQINPHFLFNTLNMISCMAKLEEAGTTERMISSLGSLFRYNLKMSEQIVPLELELKAAQDYMYIQQMRFGSRIQYECRLKVDSQRTMIPAFTLQPLMENAVVHGIAKKEEGGRIILKIWKEKGRTVISVADTGLGMEARVLSELMDALKQRRTSKVGIGLGNIYQRVKSMYKGGELKIYSRAGSGTVIQIILPPQERADDE